MYKKRSEDFKKRMLAEFGDDPELKSALENGESLGKWLNLYVVHTYGTEQEAVNRTLATFQAANLKNPELPVGEALRQFIVRRGLYEEDSTPIQQVA